MFESGTAREARGLTNRQAKYFCHDGGDHGNSLVRKLSKSRFFAQETEKLLLLELKTQKSRVALIIRAAYFSKNTGFPAQH
jgi:hypothetical protein